MCNFLFKAANFVVQIVCFISKFTKTSRNDLFGHLGKWQTQTLKQKSWLKLCRGGSNEKFEPPRQNLRQTSKSMGAGDGGRPVACRACLALMTPMAYRPIIYPSRTASCKSCASGRSQPCYCLWRSTIRRGEGTLAGSAKTHAASTQPMHSRDSGSRLEVHVTSTSRGNGSYVARVQAFGQECTIQRDRMY